MKTQSIINLVGVDMHADPAKTADTVAYFIDRVTGLTVCNITDSTVTLRTKRDTYTLTKHKTLNIYQGICNGMKVHFSMKKIVAKVIYWA